MNVLIDMPVYQPMLDTLKKMPRVNVELIETPGENLRHLPTEQIKKCDILFCSVPPENHMEMSLLKMIQISSAGYKQVIRQDFEERGIHVCNALGVFDIPIAEWNMAMMVNMARDIRALIRNQDNHVWDRSARFQREIRGLVVGLWGYGGIGRETARLAKAMGMKVHVLSRRAIQSRDNIYCMEGTGDYAGVLPDKVFLMDEKETFLKGLDFLIIAIPQTATTEGLVGETELKMLRPEAFLINPARGVVIQEQALLKALRENWIAGAALDTHYYYPMPADHPLWSMQNVVMTPHISGSSASPKFLERVWDIFIQNVKNLQQGQHLLNELTTEQLKGA
jgi:phosphoglycerate dehydrogenase-like enzyme